MNHVNTKISHRDNLYRININGYDRGSVGCYFPCNTKEVFPEEIVNSQALSIKGINYVKIQKTILAKGKRS